MPEKATLKLGYNGMDEYPGNRVVFSTSPDGVYKVTHRCGTLSFDEDALKKLHDLLNKHYRKH